MLRPYRVLDLTTAEARLGPMIMGSLGAEVVLVRPPVAESIPSPVDVRALAFDRGKRLVELDVHTAAEKEQLLELVRDADFVFESSAPGKMQQLGLDFASLCQVSPKLIYVAVTPFGQDGPYAKHLSTDLTLTAMSGVAAINGDRDRPPLRTSVPQAWYHAASESAVSALVAHRRMQQTGEPQFVDVSVQASLFWAGLNTISASVIQGSDFERGGTDLQLGTITIPVVYPCADGDVVLNPLTDTLRQLLKWMKEDGTADDAWLGQEEWLDWEQRLLRGKHVVYSLDDVLEKVREFTRKYTKSELLRRGLETGIVIAPVNTVKDVLDFSHLEERGYWDHIDVDGHGTVKTPGPIARIHRPARRTGRSLRLAISEEKDALPFAGLKVIDFSWIVAGPTVTKYLSDHGATVIRVESNSPLDLIRAVAPFKDGEFGLDRSQFFANYNSGKKSISLNMKSAEGAAIARKLIAWADVCIESFSSGTFARMGFGVDEVQEINPDLVMVSSSLMGTDGVASSLAGFGYHAAAIAGFYQVTGWPDRPSSGPYMAYTDVVAPRFLAAATLAVLDHRRRTGESPRIEHAQLESSLHLMAPELIRFQLDGTVPNRCGNEDPYMAPHNLYPASGEDEWLAIAIETDDQWKALCGVLGSPVSLLAVGFDSADGRRRGIDVIDREISKWSERLDKHEAMELLQAAGVPAGAVQRSHDLQIDPQLSHRKFFRTLEHTESGATPYAGHQFIIKGYDNGPIAAGPCLGEHTAEVLLEILGLSDEEFATFIASDSK